MCLFKSDVDSIVSRSIRIGNGWETNLSLLIVNMLSVYADTAVFLDVGTNIGTHALFVAKRGFHVFGVEPQAVNLVRVASVCALHPARVLL